MANLTRRFTWKKWAPDIGENRELEGGPVLFLELASGLTPAQMRDVGEALSKAKDVEYAKVEVPEGATEEQVTALYEAARCEFLAAIRSVINTVLSPYVRVHGGPHTVDGEQLATLDDYLRICELAADTGLRARRELEQAFVRFNSIDGPDELFSPRSSGGARSTDAQSTAPAGRKTASP